VPADERGRVANRFAFEQFFFSETYAETIFDRDQGNRESDRVQAEVADQREPQVDHVVLLELVVGEISHRLDGVEPLRQLVVEAGQTSCVALDIVALRW